MKNTILTIVTVACLSIASATGFAAEKTILKLGNFSKNINTISISESGKAKIELSNKTVKVVTLQTSTVTELTYAAQTLSSADIKQETSPIICMMMIMPFSLPELAASTVDSNGELTGTLRLVYKQSSCAVAQKLYPADPYALERAMVTVEVLKVLASELGQVSLN